MSRLLWPIFVVILFAGRGAEIAPGLSTGEDGTLRLAGKPFRGIGVNYYDAFVRTLAPDEQEEGTNALALTPPAPDFFRFGRNSFQTHLELAKTRGMAVRILRRPGLAHDLDTPDEYRQYAKERAAGAMA